MGVPQNTDPGTDPRKYVQLAAQLRRDIETGTLRPGDLVPSIAALATGRGVWARQTCAQALRLLQAEGHVVRVSGLGYHVIAAHTGTADDPRPAVLQVADQLCARREDPRSPG